MLIAYCSGCWFGHIECIALRCACCEEKLKALDDRKEQRRQKEVEERRRRLEELRDPNRPPQENRQGNIIPL